jgi:hypothetical protein
MSRNPFDELRPEIPIEDAAAFFVGIKKFAEWTDPPDMAGELEGQFAVPVEQVLHQLKVVITAKFRKMVAYHVYAESFRGPWWRAVKDEFHSHAYDERCGGDYYTKRAVALGGPVHMDPIEPPPPSNNPLGILKIMARAEQEGIMAQRELRDMVGDDNPMRIGIENHMVKDQHHLDEVWQMMTQPEHASLEGGGEGETEGDLPQPGEGASEEGLPPTEEGLPAEAPPPPPEETVDAPSLDPEVAAAEEAGPPEGEPDPELEELPPEEKMASMRMAKYAKDKKTDKELKETGRERGVTSMAAEAHREKSRRGERYGGLGGRLLGAAGGGAAGHRASKGLGLGGQLTGTAVGALGGSMLGRHVGRELGTEVDIAKNAAAAMRFTRALEKRGQGVGAEAQMASPAPNQEMQPQNYLQAEMAGQQAQQANESGYYREQLQQSSQQMQGMQQQVQMAQEQLQGLQQQAEQANQQVQQAAQSAQQAHDMATEQTMQAAKARIGAQQMRQQMLQLASQDPQALGEQAMGPSPEEMAMQQQQQAAQQGMPGAEAGQAPGEAPPDAAGGAPAPPEGPAGQAPAPQTAPGAAPPEGAADMNAPAGGMPGADMQGAEGASHLKTGAVNPRMMGGAVGAGMGAGLSVIQGARAPMLRDRVSQLQGQQDGGFMQAARLAKAQAASAHADLAQKHPGVSAIKGGLMGGVGGALLGPSIAQKAQAIRKDLPDAARGLGRVLGMK